jgi:hypothetical protein
MNKGGLSGCLLPHVRRIRRLLLEKEAVNAATRLAKTIRSEPEHWHAGSSHPETGGLIGENFGTDGCLLGLRDRICG